MHGADWVALFLDATNGLFIWYFSLGNSFSNREEEKKKVSSIHRSVITAGAVPGAIVGGDVKIGSGA